MPSKRGPKPRASGRNRHPQIALVAPRPVQDLWREAAADEGSPFAKWARELLTAQAALQLKRDPVTALRMLDEEAE